MEKYFENKWMIATIGLSALSLILIVGWVIPDFPYVRRLSKEKATKLLDEFKMLYFKNWQNVKNSSMPKLTSEEVMRWDEILLKLIKAGYSAKVVVNEAEGIVDSSMSYPVYAQ